MTESNDWINDLIQHYPNWEQGIESLSIKVGLGDHISGKVIAKAPFGVWLDVNEDVPALLLVTEMLDAGKTPIKYDDYPNINDQVKCIVSVINETKGTIGVKQL